MIAKSTQPFYVFYCSVLLEMVTIACMVNFVSCGSGLAIHS